MMRSLSSAVSGLRAHQTKMDVIGNNIANVNTYGFKSSRVTFADVYYQNLSSGSAATNARGGTNPTQIGYGASVATIDMLMNPSSAAQTDRAMDVHITSDGFLVTEDSRGNKMFTRLGNLGFDAEGNLVDFQGNFVMGFQTDGDGNPIISPDGTVTDEGLERIQVDPALLDTLTGITIQSNGMIVGILEGDTTIQIGSTAPSWIDADSATIPEDSDISGGIRLRVRAQFDPASILTALNAVGGASPAGLTVTGPIEIKDLSDSLCLQDDLVVTASPDGTITISGKYINESGKEVTFSSHAKRELDPTHKGSGEYVFTHNGKQLFTLDIPTVQFEQVLEPNYGKNPAITGTWNFNTITQGALDTLVQGLFNRPAAPGSFLQGPDIDAGVLKLANVHADMTDVKSLEMDVDINGNVTIKGTYEVGGVTRSFTGSGKLTFDDNGKVTVAPSFNVVDDDSNTVLFRVDYDLTAGDIELPRDGSKSNYATANLKGTYYYQGTWTDKGDNVRYEPKDANGNPDWAAITSAGGTFSFGDFSVNFNAGMASAYNANIGTAKVSNSIKLDIGCLVLAKFRNAQALLQEGDSHYVESTNSGEAVYQRPGTNGTGGLKSGYLEQSNVDISKEFTDMITTQRGFQANTRIVTVSDEMLQELVNLKR